MFVMSAGLEKSGCIRALGAGFKSIAGGTELSALIILMGLGAVLSAFVNNTPVVVVVLPIVLSLAKSTELKSSRLLMPLSYACILGGTCTLTGSSTNLIIDGISQNQGLEPFSMFELTKLGAIYAAVGFLYMLTIGRKLLPKHDLVIVSDYGHGMISETSAKIICKNSKYLALNAQINAANVGYHSMKKYKNVDCMIINEKEIRHELRDKNGNIKLLMKRL